MAPPRKLDADLKRPRSVSLSNAQHETFLRMGASSWLQSLLDAEGAQQTQGRAALPHFVKVDPAPARRGKKPGHANIEDVGAITPKTRVLRLYPKAYCTNTADGARWQVWTPGVRPHLGIGSTSREAWADADNKIINSGKAAQKGSK